MPHETRWSSRHDTTWHWFSPFCPTHYTTDLCPKLVLLLPVQYAAMFVLYCTGCRCVMLHSTTQSWWKQEQHGRCNNTRRYRYCGGLRHRPYLAQWSMTIQVCFCAAGSSSLSLVLKVLAVSEHLIPPQLKIIPCQIVQICHSQQNTAKSNAGSALTPDSPTDTLKSERKVCYCARLPVMVIGL